MNQPTAKKFRLTSRDRDIIEHVVRDRITTNEIVQRRFFGGAHPTSVTRTTARLCDEGWLASFPLVYPTRYFLPGKLAISAYGLPIARCYPLGPQSLPTEYAVLEYTSAHTEKLRRLAAHEVQGELPWYSNDWLLAPHCTRVAGNKTVLELLRVDLGGPADHIARKCVRDIETRSHAIEFSELIAASRFSMVLITGATHKAAAIQHALDQHRWPQQLQFRIAVFPSLIPLLPRSL